MSVKCSFCGKLEPEHTGDAYDDECDGFNPHPPDLPDRDAETGEEHCLHVAGGKNKGGWVCCWCGDIFSDDKPPAPQEHGPYSSDVF